MAILLFIFFQTPSIFAQLDCKTAKRADNSTVKKCFHKKGTISTIETWDKDKRDGTLKGFDRSGKELFSHNLRNFGGHASAQMTYFPNGQVKSIYYSDAPDGGIQYYHSTTQFDEAGNQISFDESSNLDKVHLRTPAPLKSTIRDTTQPKAH
nr:hypothetical protein [uncultured Fluviicola sp.]